VVFVVKVVGLCYSVYWIVLGFCDVVGVLFEGISYWVVGVNY